MALKDPEDLPVALAAALRRAGLRWHPTAGDRFVVTDGTLDGEVFTVSDMVVEVIGEGTGGAVLGFNGTTEWALDSVPVESALWLPREGQLRRLLGGSFRRLDVSGDGYGVHVRGAGSSAVPAAGDAGGGEQVFVGATAAQAYGEALLSVISRALD